MHASTARLAFLNVKTPVNEIISPILTSCRAVSALHIVGGGSNNEMLNRFTADALGIPVLAGPSEATAIGNLLLQARALGLVGDLWEMRRIVADSFGVRRIEPGDRAPWDAAYKTYREIVGR